MSYAHVDLPRVQQLADFLRMGGHDVWFDQRLVGGQPWKEQLRTQIKTSQCFLYALTPASVASDWCQWEFAQAVHMGKKLVTVLLEECKLDGALKDHQYIDFTQGDSFEAGLRLGTAVFAAEPIPPEKVPLLPAPDDTPERPIAHTNPPVVGNDLVQDLYTEAYQAYRAKAYKAALEPLHDIFHIDQNYADAQKLLKLVELKLDEQQEQFFRTLRQTTASILPAPFEWIEIPGGPFLMGSDKEQDPAAYDDELPQIPVDVPPFYIAKYPVTYAQYELFVAGDGYTNNAYWTAAGREWRGRKRHPEYGWQDDNWHIADHPVVSVTWYEAYAFAQWLGAALTPGLSSSGRGEWSMRLPTEVEWEKASRGTDGRIYPWGSQPPTNELCNFSSNVGRTTPVTRYPQGASPYGVMDLSGNVWEWCLTQAPDGNFWRYADGPETMEYASEGDAPRVLRGGSWRNSEYVARCAYRHDHSPYGRRNDVGFRVVCGRPPSLSGFSDH